MNATTEVVGRESRTGQWWGAGLAVASVGWGAQQFTPMLPLYQHLLGLPATTVQGLFGLYVAGLIPGLLFGGPVSDRFGRRAVMLPTLVISALASGLLILGGEGVGWLFAGRMLGGIASGAAFSCGAAWIKELSISDDGVNHGPRRLTVAMSIGFGVGPLVAGLVAQWLPAPTVVAYLPHLLLVVVAVPLALRTRDSAVRGAEPLLARLRIPEVRQRQFLGVVVPLAPWVFGAAAIALSYAPSLVVSRLHGYAVIFTAVAAMLTAGAGILVQPLARRIDRSGGPRLLVTALAMVVAGLLVAAIAAVTGSAVLVGLTALVLGAGYGACQVCGLLEVQRLARPERLAGLTAVYQAASYVGFVVPYPMAAAAGVLRPAELLLILAALAVLTLVVTLRNVRR